MMTKKEFWIKTFFGFIFLLLLTNFVSVFVLVGHMQLCKILCLSVVTSVSPSVRPYIGPLVRKHESKSGKTSVLDVFISRCVGVGAWGVDGGWMPLPTRPQRYCDPASLVNKEVGSKLRSTSLARVRSHQKKSHRIELDASDWYQCQDNDPCL